MVTANVPVMPVGNENRAIGSGATVGWTIPRILALQHVHDLAGVAGTAALDRICTHHKRAWVAMHHLSLKDSWQKISLVDGDAGRGDLASLDEVWNNARVVLMPVARWDVGLLIGTLGAPAASGKFIRITVVTKLLSLIHI